MSVVLDLPAGILAAIKADASRQGRSVEQVLAEQIHAWYGEQDDEHAAVNEALDELEAGKGRPFVEFTREFDARCAV